MVLNGTLSIPFLLGLVLPWTSCKENGFALKNITWSTKRLTAVFPIIRHYVIFNDIRWWQGGLKECLSPFSPLTVSWERERGDFTSSLPHSFKKTVNSLRPPTVYHYHYPKMSLNLSLTSESPMVIELEYFEKIIPGSIACGVLYSIKRILWHGLCRYPKWWARW